MIDEELALAQAMVSQIEDHEGWTAEFNWHRDEVDLDKAKLAARSIIDRLHAAGFRIVFDETA